MATIELRSLAWSALVGGALASSSLARVGEMPAVHPNPNLERAGVFHDGVLTVALEAKESSWRIHGPARPAMTIQAFSEIEKEPVVPGPLLRAPQGTEIRVSVHNALGTPLTFFVPTAIHGGPDRITAMDSVVIAPGATGQLVTRATTPGNYLYRGTTPTAASNLTHVAGLLAGGLVVDSVPASADDRVLVMMETLDSASVAFFNGGGRGNFGSPEVHEVFTINGRSWPNTERIPATVGDSVRWRVINASPEAHPMHLHGFYYRVDAFSSPGAELRGRPAPGQMVVTQLLSAFSTMSMSWSPNRPGNWIFHCHFAVHNTPDSMSTAPGDPSMRDMVGLILGVNVAAKPGVPVPAQTPAVRHLRLVAVPDTSHLSSSSDKAVSPMRFVIEESGRRVETKRAISPELDLTRGESVSIMIVNRLREPTSIHWHGMELQDSYYDGVPGVSGDGARLSPAIAPGDSFEARFTPPRSGTFMYHAHLDEVRQQAAGLEGALIVREPGASRSEDDHVFFLKGNHLYTGTYPVEMNGELNPDTLILRVGRPARLRLINLATTTVMPSFTLTARPDSVLATASDSMIVRWRPLAKDGFDLPANQQVARPARQVVAMGETYDFEFIPLRKGMLRLEVRGSETVPLLKVRVPIRVE